MRKGGGQDNLSADMFMVGEGARKTESVNMLDTQWYFVRRKRSTLISFLPTAVFLTCFLPHSNYQFSLPVFISLRLLFIALLFTPSLSLTNPSKNPPHSRLPHSTSFLPFHISVFLTSLPVLRIFFHLYLPSHLSHCFPSSSHLSPYSPTPSLLPIHLLPHTHHTFLLPHHIYSFTLLLHSPARDRRPSRRPPRLWPPRRSEPKWPRLLTTISRQRDTGARNSLPVDEAGVRLEERCIHVYFDCFGIS